MSSPKRFDELWYDIKCQQCTHWWDNSCDGSLRGSTSDCRSFSPTRSVTIPLEIKRLKKVVYSLITTNVIFVAILFWLVVKNIV